MLKYERYKVNGVTFYTRELDERRTVQNSGVTLVAKTMQIASVKDKNPVTSDMVFYGVIEEICKLEYTKLQILMFKCNWVDDRSVKVLDNDRLTIVNLAKIGFKDDSFILASQAKQVFYVEDPIDSSWSVVLDTPTRDYFENISESEYQEYVIQQSSEKLSTKYDATLDEDDSVVRKDCEGTWIEHEQK